MLALLLLAVSVAGGYRLKSSELRTLDMEHRVHLPINPITPHTPIAPPHVPAPPPYIAGPTLAPIYGEPIGVAASPITGSCPTPPLPAYAIWAPPAPGLGVDSGNTIGIYCSAGYYMNGNYQMICGSDGKWGAPFGNCAPITCSIPIGAGLTVVSGCTGTYNSQCTLTCAAPTYVGGPWTAPPCASLGPYLFGYMPSCSLCQRKYTCAAYNNANCGSIPDCDQTLDCGACGPNSTCYGYHCVPCQAATCDSIGAQCGSYADACSQSVLQCGECPGHIACVGNTCISPQDKVRALNHQLY